MEKLMVSQSPHVQHEDSSRGIMVDVLIALLPLAVAGAILFGWKAALIIAICVVTAVATEFVCCKIMKRENSIGDCSAAVTGLILAMNLPPEIKWWMAVIGSIVAIAVVKMMFGGLGHNFANPAITARIVLLVSFPAAMTTWTAPLGAANLATSATDVRLWLLHLLPINIHIYNYLWDRFPVVSAKHSSCLLLPVLCILLHVA